MNDEQRRQWAHAIFKSLPGYPFLPCPICGGNEGCDDTVRERAQATHPGLVLNQLESAKN